MVIEANVMSRWRINVKYGGNIVQTGIEIVYSAHASEAESVEAGSMKMYYIKLLAAAPCRDSSSASVLTIQNK